MSVCFRCYCLEKSFIFLAHENDQMVKQIKIGKEKFKHFVNGFKQVLARVKFFSVTHFLKKKEVGFIVILTSAK